MRATIAIGTALAATIGIALMGFGDQEKKMDTRASVGTMPGGVTLYASTKTVPLHEGLEVATFAAGCFWGVEDAFRQLEGVKATAVGYSGGKTENPTYKEVCYTDTGHAEAIRVEFDPKKISYKELVEFFFDIHNPAQMGGQGPDFGDQYRSVVFYHNDEQMKTAKTVRDAVAVALKKAVVTQIVPEATFYMAEEYHQQYNMKNGSAACPIPVRRSGGG